MIRWDSRAGIPTHTSSLQSHHVGGGLSLVRFIVRNGVSAGVRRYSRSVTTFQQSVPTSSRREHVSLVVGFGRLDLGLGSSIWVYGGGGGASATHRASSYERSEYASIASWMGAPASR